DDLADGGALATLRAVGVNGFQVETTHERTPGNIGCIEQVTDVLGVRNGLRARARAGVAGRIDIADQGEAAAAVSNQVRVPGARCLRPTVGLAGKHVDRAGRRRTILVSPGVVAHRVVLSVVPESGDGVAVEITHHLAGGAERASAAIGALAGVRREEVVLA